MSFAAHRYAILFGSLLATLGVLPLLRPLGFGGDWFEVLLAGNLLAAVLAVGTGWLRRMALLTRIGTVGHLLQLHHAGLAGLRRCAARERRRAWPRGHRSHRWPALPGRDGGASGRRLALTRHNAGCFALRAESVLFPKTGPGAGGDETVRCGFSAQKYLSHESGCAAFKVRYQRQAG